MKTMGASSAVNCDNFGWEPVGALDPFLVAETAQDARHGYGRAWSRASRYSLRPDPRTLYFVHTVEGGFDFTVGAGGVRADPGQLVVFDGHVDVGAETIAETARYVWFFRPTVLRPGMALLDLHEPITLTNAAMRSLMSMTNALLNAGATAGSEAHRHIGEAIEHLLVAALTDGGEGGDVHSMHRDGLFTASQFVISQYFRDPEFDVTRLAKELNTSRNSVYKVFASMGTSPRREIERYRIEDVERSLARVRTFQTIVMEAGFKSMRQYNSAAARAVALKKRARAEQHR